MRPEGAEVSEGRPGVRVLLADDQRLVRESLGTLLRLVGGIELVGTACDGAEAVALAELHRPEVVLMDLRMPRMDGIEATRRIRERLPEVRVVALTTYADDETVLGALRAGARGYLTKDAGAEDIRAAIFAVAAGEAAIDPSVQRHLVEALSDAPSGSAGAPGTADGLPDGLTRREVEVLVLIAAGLSNQEIADRLVVAPTTVKSHINHLFAKAGLRDRAQAVHYAYCEGLVAPPA
ncbi:MAG: response regulator [Solirubrobacteraceae bacterium]